jgi:bacteriocin-like protein
MEEGKKKEGALTELDDTQLEQVTGGIKTTTTQSI